MNLLRRINRITISLPDGAGIMDCVVIPPKPMCLKSVFGLLLLTFLSVSLVQADTLDNRVRDISNKLRCPTCQAQSVKDSDAGLSLNMKQKIRELLEEGKTEAEILDFFVVRYGEWILRSPRKSGFALLLWLLPGVVLIVTALVLIRFMRRGATTRVVSDHLKPLTKEEKKKIDKALKNI